MVEIKFGCVTVLDALGTRTASIAQAQAYLKGLADIKSVMAQFDLCDKNDQLVGRIIPEFPGGEFQIRFFADSILITLPFEREHLNWVPIARMFSGAAAVVATSLSRGFLFRGALAIGEYLESEDAVLGPAILDAAQWYDMPDMLGVIATPSAMFFVQSLLADKAAIESWPAGAAEGMGVSYTVPLKNGRNVLTNVADWTFSARVRSSDAMRNLEKWFFTVLQGLGVSPDVEGIYRHSLEFLRDRDAQWGCHRGRK
jgi:hypothetical protein